MSSVPDTPEQKNKSRRATRASLPVASEKREKYSVANGKIRKIFCGKLEKEEYILWQIPKRERYSVANRKKRKTLWQITKRRKHAVANRKKREIFCGKSEKEGNNSVANRKKKIFCGKLQNEENILWQITKRRKYAVANRKKR